MSNLRLINETTVSAVSSATVTDIFTADFDIYKVSVTGLNQNDATTNVGSFRLVNTSGSIITASNYDVATLNMDSYGSFSEGRSTNQTRLYRFLGNLNDEPDDANATLYVFNPTSTSSYTFLLQQADSKWTSGFSSFKGIGVLKNTSAVGGINFFSEGTAGKTISATVRTYGLRVDS